MNDIIQVVFSPRFFLAAVVFVLLSLLITWLGIWLQKKLHDAPFNDWLAEHVGIPLLNVIAMILFIAILYPVLFPQEAIPSFLTLLTAESGRMNQLVNWVFVLSLMIPMIPVLGPRIEIVFPIQGIVVVGLITNWMSQYLEDPRISLLPGGMDFLWMLILGVIGARLAVSLSRAAGDYIDGQYHLAHTGAFIYPILALILQTPTLALYARSVMSI